MKIQINKKGEVKKTEGKFPYPKNGSCLQDYINISYKNLVKVFGKQNDKTDEYKTDAEWFIKTPAGFATIYNYKDGKNYNGKDGLEIKNIMDWHIGGENRNTAEYIFTAIKKNLIVGDLRD